MDDVDARLEKAEARIEDLEQERKIQQDRLDIVEAQVEALYTAIDKMVRRERTVAAAYNISSDSLDPWSIGGLAEPGVELDE